MASQVIENAISLGAPAYNAGNVELCAEVYADAARELMQRYAAELSPEVMRSLQATYRSSGAMRAGTSADEIAWSFRKGFDAHLALAALQGTSGSQPAMRPDRSVRQQVSEALRAGVPAYNAGDAERCVDVYAATIREILKRPDLDRSARQALAAQLQVGAGVPDAKEKAWILRRALDAVAGGPAAAAALGGSGGLRTASTPPSSNRPIALQGGNRMIRDFSKQDGLQVRASVVNDTVMGGRSKSAVRDSAEGVIFQGTVTKAGGGGFASVRFQPVDRKAFASALGPAQGVVVHLKLNSGCPAWKFQLHEGYDSCTWQADFKASPSGTVQRIPFSAFFPTWRGKPQGERGISDEAKAKIQSFGFMLSFLDDSGGYSSAFQEGQFSLTISRVELY